VKTIFYVQDFFLIKNENHHENWKIILKYIQSSHRKLKIKSKEN